MANARLLFMKVRIEGRATFRKMWPIMDVLILICQTYTFYEVFSPDTYIILGRIMECCLFMLLLTKSLYFLQLIGEIAPLIDIIFVIMSDIKYFVVILGITMVAFVNAFYMIGKN